MAATYTLRDRKGKTYTWRSAELDDTLFESAPNCPGPTCRCTRQQYKRGARR